MPTNPILKSAHLAAQQRDPAAIQALLAKSPDTLSRTGRRQLHRLLETANTPLEAPAERQSRCGRRGDPNRSIILEKTIIRPAFDAEDGLAKAEVTYHATKGWRVKRLPA